MIPMYYEGIPVVTIYYVVTRAIMLAALMCHVARRVWRGNWHTEGDKSFYLVLLPGVLLCPASGEIVSLIETYEALLRSLNGASKRRALSIRAEESRQHPEAGQLTIKDNAP